MSKVSEQKKVALLRAACTGGDLRVMAQSEEARAFAEWSDAKAALALAEKIETTARARVDQIFVAKGVATVATPTDTFVLVVRERAGYDLDKIPADVLAAAKVVTSYVVLVVKEG